MTQLAHFLRCWGYISGKVVIDTTNPLSADYMSLTLGHSTSAEEEITNSFPAEHIVKAFNTTFAQVVAKGMAFFRRAGCACVLCQG
ncbi:MAG: hypothetical protein ACR5LD_06895 [Symbiopectobacterium sp.]